MITNNSLLGNTQFVTYKFCGNKFKFRNIQEEIYTNITAERRRYGCKYLTESWPGDDITGELELDEEELPAEIMRMPPIHWMSRNSV